MQIVHFIRNHGPYTPGDVAGFEDATAYINSGVAELVVAAAVVDVAPVAPEAGDTGDTVQASPPVARKGRAKS